MTIQKIIVPTVSTLATTCITLLVLSACNSQLTGNVSRNDINLHIDPQSLPKAEKVIGNSKALLQELTEDQTLIHNIVVHNEKNQSLSVNDIEEIDNVWQSKKSMPLVTELLASETSELLQEFAQQHTGFDEIFVTDAHGLVVGLTNRTSDYWQADEAWWAKTFNDGDGKIHNGAIEYDESANVNAVPIYIPIFDADKKAIGVLKAVLNITTVFEELNN